MAGDWIKVRIDLGDDPAVIRMASTLGLDEDAIVGKLHRLWSWADRHATNGFAIGINPKWVDRYVNCPKFSDSIMSVGWLEFCENGVTFPNFDRHNGKSAKTRCDAAIRQRLSRKERDNGVTGDERSAIPRPFRSAVLKRDQYTCAYCGDESSPSIEESKRARLSVDHITPSARGGRSSMENLLTCCKGCNLEKNDRTPEEWGLLPSFLADGVTYRSQKICDISVTDPLQKPLPEKRREDNKENIQKKVSKGRADSEFEVIEYIISLGLSKSDGSYLWNSWEAGGWKRGGEPLKDWRAAARAWKQAGYFPSQKATQSLAPQKRATCL